MYAPIARIGDANAQKGLARVIAARGELERSERAWRDVLDIRPNDAEALTGLAQILSWQGRPAETLPQPTRSIRSGSLGALARAPSYSFSASSVRPEAS